MTAPGERLAALVRHAIDLLASKKKKEEELKEVSELLDRVQRTDLPELLKELGMSDATLADLGVKVALSQGVEASIPEPSRAEAFAWLAENGYGAIVKSEVKVVFGAAELEKAQECAALLTQGEYLPQVGMNVHPQVLKSWAKERLTAGEVIPPELFNVRAYDMARITAIKRKS